MYKTAALSSKRTCNTV